MIFRLSVFLFAATSLTNASAAPSPTVYTVTQTNALFGPAMQMTIHRDGDRAVIDNAGPDGTHTRSYYDLKAGRNFSWDTKQSSPECGSGRFSGDWGDPFVSSLDDDLSKLQVKDAGHETISGLNTKIIEATDPKTSAKYRLWRDEKYGMLVRLEMPDAQGKPHLALDTTQVSVGQHPPAAIFTMPPSCAKLAAEPPPKTPAEIIADETGGRAEDYESFSTGPASPKPCNVRIRAVEMKTQKPLTHYQIALDLSYDPEHPAAHTIGIGTDGHLTFSGGEVHELTSSLQNGVLHVANVPAMFSIEVGFGQAGSANAVVYRKCFGSESELLILVKNPALIRDGFDWLWVKKAH